jgi:hypothetical protein
MDETRPHPGKSVEKDLMGLTALKVTDFTASFKASVKA